MLKFDVTEGYIINQWRIDRGGWGRDAVPREASLLLLIRTKIWQIFQNPNYLIFNQISTTAHTVHHCFKLRLDTDFFCVFLMNYDWVGSRRNWNGSCLGIVFLLLLVKAISVCKNAIGWKAQKKWLITVLHKIRCLLIFFKQKVSVNFMGYTSSCEICATNWQYANIFKNLSFESRYISKSD